MQIMHFLHKKGTKCPLYGLILLRKTAITKYATLFRQIIEKLHIVHQTTTMPYFYGATKDRGVTNLATRSTIHLLESLRLIATDQK